MNINEIESLRRKIDSVNTQIGEKRANIKVLKEQLTKKVQELKALGINALDEAETKINELNAEYETLYNKIDKAVENANQQLRVEEEVF